jgi:hypothetical protein
LSLNLAVDSLTLNNRTYAATPEGNRNGTVKVFDTTGLSNLQLEAQVRTHASDLAGGAPLTPVAGNPPNVWTVAMADGTKVNLRAVSSSTVGNTGSQPRWAIDIIGNPSLQQVMPAAGRFEIKFK